MSILKFIWFILATTIGSFLLQVLVISIGLVLWWLYDWIKDRLSGSKEAEIKFVNGLRMSPGHYTKRFRGELLSLKEIMIKGNHARYMDLEWFGEDVTFLTIEDIDALLEEIGDKLDGR